MDLINEITEAYQAYLTKEGKRSPVRSNTVGLLSHPCARRVYYFRMHWEDAPEFGPGAVEAMQRGQMYEAYTIRLLQDLGYQIDRQEDPVEWKEYQISGKIDGMIRRRGEHPDKAIPLEIKSMTRWLYEPIETWQNIRDHKFAYIRNYVLQLQLYMIMTRTVEGIFALRCGDSGGLKLVPMPLDVDLAKFAVDRADQVCYAMLNGSAPERIDYDPAICDRCEWFGLCEHPDAKSIPPAILDAPWLEEALEERAAVEEASKRYASLDRAIKDHVKKAVEDRALCGAWEIKVTRGGYMRDHQEPCWISNVRVSARKIGGV